MENTTPMLLTVSDTNLDDLCAQLKQIQTKLNHGDSINHQLNELNQSNKHLTYRFACCGTQHSDITQTIADFLAQPPAKKTQPKTAFLFTGQGSQYINMAAALYQYEPVFRTELTRCNDLITAYGQFNLIQLLYHAQDIDAATTQLTQTQITQPALFAIEYALAKLWQSYGIEPDFMIGHSVGEYVAATLANIMSLNEGLQLICKRGQLMQTLPAGGCMAAVMADETTLNTHINNQTVDFACFNSPKQTVLSGPIEAVESCVTQLKAQKIRAKVIPTSHAFHSSMMEPILKQFHAVASTVNYREATIPMANNIDGKLATPTTYQADYWTQHIRQPVRFMQGIQTLAASGVTQWIEIGAQPALIGMTKHIVPDSDQHLYLASLKKGISIPDFYQSLVYAYSSFASAA